MVFETRQIWTSSQLPTLSVLGMKVLELSRHPETTARDLLGHLQTDEALCDEIIAAANSPLCAASEPVLNVEQAIQSLGNSAVTSLTLSLLVRETCLNTGLPQPHVAAFWRQTVVKAVAAETLCGQVREGLDGEYFLAGLLVDLGRFVLLRTATQNYLTVLEKARQELLPLWRKEQTELGVTSAQIGAQLVEHWGLPTRLVQGIHAQFAPLTTFKQMASTTDYPLWGALALASAIGDYYCGDQQALAWFRIRELTTEILPMSEPEVNDLLQRIATRFAAVAEIMTVGNPSLPALEQLKANAIAQLKPIQRQAGSPAAPSVAPAAAINVSERRGFSASTPTSSERTFRDPLTMVFTPEFFEETLYKEVQRCRQIAAPLGVACVGIDRFPDLVRQHGESFGNAVLKRLAGLLKDLLRSSDTIARFDQQFAILASDPTAKGMQRLADRIRGRVAGEPLTWSGQNVTLTVSVGATLALPGRRDQLIGTQVLAIAKRALEEASAGEGNNVYFESLVDEVELQRLFMTNQFRFSRWLISRGVLDIPRVGKAMLDFTQHPLRLGELALRQELLTQREVDEILEDQEDSQDRFGQVAVRRELLTEDQMVGLLILQQEDPVHVAEHFLRLAILDQEHLQVLLKEYFSVVPWAAPLYPSAGNS